jgi:tripartite-type tricarboxylate transporter receptor subunit TctC
MKRVAAFALGLAVSFLAAAQDSFPTKTVRIIVPYPAGGPADLLPRVVG